MEYSIILLVTEQMLSSDSIRNRLRKSAFPTLQFLVVFDSSPASSPDF